MAAYCRVSTEKEEQEKSFETQKEMYTERIMLEHHHTQAGFLEKPGGEKAGDAGADDGDIGAFVLCQPLPRLKYTVFCPERFHINTSLSRDFGLTVPGIPVRYTPKERYNREKMCAGDDSLPNM